MRKTIVFAITGMHCTSCALNIDGELEDTDGIQESRTDYARQKTTVVFDPEKITQERILAIIASLNYTAAVIGMI